MPDGRSNFRGTGELLAGLLQLLVDDRGERVHRLGADELPTSSKVTYALDANKLTKQQIMNFFKLWLICVGPTNDE